ncbi:MAG: recombinase family protein [Clostridium sp.]|nr:recombinase family protein [Clostridium sp.]
MARKSRKGQRPDAQQSAKVIWRCCSYCRLSDEDPSGRISNSIENQRNLNRAYMNQRPDLVYAGEFIDDGKSGTTFSREGFVRMMKEITAGHINCIVVKDLSRFGRNYIDTEDYITKVFPFLGVRFIAVNDGIDTISEDFHEKLLEMRLKNLTNDLYAKQVSQNVGQAFDEMGEEGICHGPVPPYGYLICSGDSGRRHLVIDEEAADIVKMIFSRFLKGESFHAITKRLNDCHIAPPMRHFSDLGLYKSKCHEKETQWYRSTVRLILENPAYCGCLAVKKHSCSLYRGIPNHKIPKEEWKFVYHTHEKLISKEEYEEVQNMLEDRKRRSPGAGPAPEGRPANLYAGKMRCGCCNRPLRRDYFKNRKGKRTFYQCCEGYKYKSTATPCKSCYINEDKLGRIIRELLGKYNQLFLEKPHLGDTLMEGPGINRDSEEGRLTRELIEIFIRKITVAGSSKLKIEFTFRDALLPYCAPGKE